MWSKEEIEAGCREFLKKEKGLIPLAKEFLRCCEATGLNPRYDGVVAYPSSGRLVFIVEHDTMIQKAAQTGDLKGIESGTRIREDSAVVAWAKVYRGEGRDMFAAEVDVAQWQAAHPRSPFWKSRPQSMAEKCARVMAVKLAFAAEFQGLRDDVTSVLYDPDKPKAESKPKAKAEPKPQIKEEAPAYEALAEKAGCQGHDIDELARRFGCLGGADMPEEVATTIERLLDTTGLCSAADYANASMSIAKLIQKGLTQNEAQQKLMQFGKVAQRKYLTPEGARAFVGWCDNAK